MSFDLSIPGGKWVDTEHEARQWIDRYLLTHRVNGGLGLDTETTGLDKIRDTVVIWSLSDGQTRICLDRKYLGLFKEPILENPEIAFDLTGAKFDAHMLANSGVDISKAGPWRDTLPQSWLLNENNSGRHGLKECITDHFGRRTPTFEETFGRVPPKRTDKATGLTISKNPGQLIREALADPEKFENAVDYASLDAYNTTMLRHHFDDLLAQESIGWGTLYDYYYRVESPFTKVLWKMERRGITVDAGYLRALEGPMQAEMDSITYEFNKACGRGINLNSTADVRWFFFEFLKKDIIKMTKGGKSGIKKESTDEEVLEKWAGKGDLWARLALRHRGISKIKGTYVDGLQKWLDAHFRIHTSLNQIGAVTGRLSSSDPNLQNIPLPAEDPYVIREAFIPSEGKILVVADYEQLEMRLMAHLSRDQRMIKAIIDGMDLHCFTTAEMEGIPYDEVLAAKKVKDKDLLTPRQEELLLKRQNNKATGFGIIYGIGGPRLAGELTRDTGVFYDEEQGWALIRKWLNVFPGVRDYIEDTKKQINSVGYVQTLIGRYRRFGDLRSMNRKDSAAAERQGVNATDQGSAADIAKMAMLRVESDPELKSLDASMLLQVHDELILECPDDKEVAEKVKERVKFLMGDITGSFGEPLLVDIPASANYGYSWASAK